MELITDNLGVGVREEGAHFQELGEAMGGCSQSAGAAKESKVM